MILLTVFSGFCVGLLVGLTGVGGGSLMTPILILLFGRHATIAVGTDLIYATVTKSVGGLVHGFRGSVDWPIVARLAAGSLPATVLTILALHALGIGGHSSPRLLTLSLGFALVASATAMLLLRRIIARFAPPRPSPGGAEARWVGAATIAAGSVLGAMVTLTSVGAGALGMTILVLLYPGRPVPRLVGTDIVYSVPQTLLAGLGQWLLGAVDWWLMATLLVGSIPGIVAGSWLSGFIPERVLRPILATTLVVTGVKLIWG
jgi:uncharacterized protein